MAPADLIESVIRPQWPFISQAQLEGIELSEADQLRNIDRLETEKTLAELLRLCSTCDRKSLAEHYRAKKKQLLEIAAEPPQDPARSKRSNDAMQWIAAKNARHTLNAMSFWFTFSGDGVLPQPSNPQIRPNSPEHFHEVINTFGLNLSIVIEVGVEIHFYEQEKVSLYLESNCSGNNEKFGELALFLLCALRMMSNLDVCEPSDGLARILMAPGMIPGASPAEMTEQLQLITHPGHAGRKRFQCKLRMSKVGCKFDLDFSNVFTKPRELILAV